MNSNSIQSVIAKLPQRKQLELMSPKPSQRKVALEMLNKKTLKGNSGAMKKAMSSGNVNDYVRAIPKHYKDILFPGYGGHNNARSYFSAYNVAQRPIRLTTMLNTADMRLKKSYKKLLNKIVSN